MVDVIVQYFSQFPAWLATFFLASLPITELRLAIPIAYTWSLNPVVIYVSAIFGNLLPFFPLFYGLKFIRKVSEKKAPWLTKMIDKIVERSKKKVEKKYVKYGTLALFFFTAIPLPFTGLYTATLGAVALKIPLKNTAIGVISGVLVAGLIVSLLSYGVDISV